MHPDLDRNPADLAEIAQLLDEHHLVVLGGTRARRRGFSRMLGEQLRGPPASVVVPLRGGRITGLPSFCAELERHLAPGQRIGRSVRGLVELLRCNPFPARRLFFLWHDADTLLETNVALFGRIANAFFGVAAELEHVSPDALVLLRMIFAGGPKLGAYAEDEHGQFRSWLLEKDASLFWEVLSCVPRPPVLTYGLEG